ncbi:MAG: hypothetical protein JWL62_753 [Hyphomicrobiales bacterium]|nr:hypothetical protein [Hyphomicrobiales bacterium]
MRRFFFDVCTVKSVAEDLVGDILPDNESAIADAAKAARQLASDALLSGKTPVPIAVHVRDEKGGDVGVVDVVGAVLEALGHVREAPDMQPQSDSSRLETAT